jgi:hypothetical protein
MSLQREVKAKLLGKRDAQQEQEVREWIEAILGEKFPPSVDYVDMLHDGKVLCRVMNKLKPDTIKINETGGQFKMMENINNFQKAIEAYGVPKLDVFQTGDLYEKKDISQVTMCLFALGRTTYNHPEFPGPWLGPRPAAENKREFSEEVIARGKATNF